MNKEKNIDSYITAAENYIRTHPDITGTTNAMIALTISIQKVNENIEKFDQTSSQLSARSLNTVKFLPHHFPEMLK